MAMLFIGNKKEQYKIIRFLLHFIHTFANKINCYLKQSFLITFFRYACKSL